MDVPANKSVKMIARWAMGSMYFCEHYDNPESVPSDAVVQWSDRGVTLCLRPQDPPLTSEADGWAEAGKLLSTTFKAVWHITPQTVVKVTSWEEGIQTEGSTIKFIKDRHPEIPVTPVIFEWIDHAWTRSFMIMRRARGVPLEDAMVYMTDSQIKDVADQVASHVKTLTQHTSKMLETVDHFGVEENRLVGLRPLKEAVHKPSWRLDLWPRFTPEEFKAHLRESSNMKSIPDSGPEFVLYNAKLTPHHITVYPPRAGAKGRLAEITDWKYTAYWPRYWVATCPNIDGYFTPFLRDNDMRWVQYLRKALVGAGFENVTKWWDAFRPASDKLRDERAGKEYEDWVAGFKDEAPSGIESFDHRQVF